LSIAFFCYFVGYIITTGPPGNNHVFVCVLSYLSDRLRSEKLTIPSLESICDLLSEISI